MAEASRESNAMSAERRACNFSTSTLCLRVDEVESCTGSSIISTDGVALWAKRAQDTKQASSLCAFNCVIAPSSLSSLRCASASSSVALFSCDSNEDTALNDSCKQESAQTSILVCFVTVIHSSSWHLTTAIAFTRSECNSLLNASTFPERASDSCASSRLRSVRKLTKLRPICATSLVNTACASSKHLSS